MVLHTHADKVNNQDEPKYRVNRDCNQQREKCKRNVLLFMHYLRFGKHVNGFAKNQQGVVLGQGKKYITDETSKVFHIFNII